LGSDVPFFLRGGTAVASGRGEIIQPLPDVSQQSGRVAWPPRRSRPDKTARMYAALRPEHYTDGSRTERLAERIRCGEPVQYADLFNVFEAVIPEVDPEGAQILTRARELGSQPHLCGSGPALYFISGQAPDDIPVDTITAAEAIPAAECTRIYGAA
jgi:4-diphosphocytidyl-2-C-methyl-D-erythritol kinase